MYLMIAVISGTKKLKDALRAVKTVGVRGGVIFDSMGSANMNRTYPGYQPMLASALMSISGVPEYKKTIFWVVESEERANAAIEAAGEALGIREKPNAGILFTIPILKFRPGDPERA